MKKLNKKGFTLIELLAVIIILGILMIIAVPAVTKYINDSRKSSYVNTAKNIAGGARNLANSGDYEMYDKDITYYIEGSCIKTENGFKSPYGEFTKAYVAVVVNDDGNEYYWTSVDSTGTGVKNLTKVNDLDIENIENGLSSGDITTEVGIDGRSKIVVIGGDECVKGVPIEATKMMNGTTGKISNACPAVTETIYWAINNNKLTISDSSVSGTANGSFPGNTEFSLYDNQVPWKNISNDITSIEIIGNVVPSSISGWFYEVGYNASTFSANLNNLNVCHATDLSYTFNSTGRYATTFNLNVSDWDTSKVNSLFFTFSNAGNSATTWNIEGLGNWDVSNVTNMGYALEYAGNSSSTFNLNLSGWDVSKVTNMEYLFSNAGRNASSFNINLNNWNTSSVTSMRKMFASAGYSATTWSLTGINNLKTGSVIDMEEMFDHTGYNATTFTLDLSSWDTSKVEAMYHIFANAGGASTTFNLNIGGWDMSSVTSMYNMFYYAASSAQNFGIVIPKTNGNGINNTTSTLYGKTASNTSAPPDGKSFTLAN